MSRKLTYNINRFDGGIANDIRTSDLSKCAHVSHFDIYRNAHALYPMPGYVSDQDTATGADDLKNYNIKAFTYNGKMLAVGTLSNGTGCKLWEKATPDTANWTAVSSGEGAYDLADNTNLHDSGYYNWITNNGGNTYLSQWDGSVTDAKATLQSGVTSVQYVTEYAFDDEYYTNTGGTDIFKVATGTVTDPAKTTAITVTDIESANEQVGIIGYSFYPHKVRMLLWDSASALADQKIEFGGGFNAALGYVGGTWVGVIDENLVSDAGFDEQANGEYSLALKVAAPGKARDWIRLYAKTNTNGAFKPSRSKYKDGMLFYARIPQDATPTTYKEGIWCVGQTTPESPISLSLLLDTSDLGSIEGYYGFGKHHYFAHAGDGSVSKLDNFSSGTYDVNAEYHTLMFGSDTPNMKELNGIAVLTEDLPSGGSVTAYYRFDEDDSWTSLGSSSTTGTEKHQFIRPSGAPIGKFREIQFKIVVSGKVIIKNIHISLTETDDLGFNS